MNQPAWLLRYYGADFEELRPSVVAEGKNKALVMLRRKSEIAYFIISKGGKHNFSTPIAAHQGAASPEQVEAMKQRLAKEDP